MTTAAKRYRKKDNKAKFGKGHAHPRDRRCLICKPLPRGARMAAGDLPAPVAQSPLLARTPLGGSPAGGFLNALASMATRRDAQRRGLPRGLTRRGR